MIALCLEWSQLNNMALVLTRVTVLLVAGAALHVLVLLWLQQPPQQMKRAVPRPVIVFTAGWLVLLIGIVLSLLVGPCQAELGPALRTAYASGFVWSIAGMAWILKLGIDWNAKVIRDQEEAERLAEAIKVTMKDEARADFERVDES